MYCQKCGKEIMDEAVICTNCGCVVNEKNLEKAIDNDKISGGLMALSIIIPLIGVILWPVKHKESPKAAKAYGIAGIISWIIWAILLV